MRRTLLSLLGLVLIGVGVYGFIALDGRSEWASLVFVGAGGFLISKSQTLEILKAAGDFILRIRGR